jgi:cobaltochelatase CobS
MTALTTLTAQAKAAIRLAAVKQGLRPSGWSDEELIAFRDGAAAAPAPAAAEPAAQTGNALVDAIAEIARAAGGTAALDEGRVIDLIKEHASQVVEVLVHNAVSQEYKVVSGGHSVLPRVLRNVGVGNNVYLVGPAGSGKTTIAEQVAGALDLPFLTQQAVQQPYDLVGFTDAGGKVVRTQFRDAFEHGGVFLADEIDSWGPEATIALNSAISNGFATFPDGQVRKHPQFTFVAAGNTYGKGGDRQYVGRNQLDAATLDRFAFIEVGYDEALETALAQAAYKAHGGSDDAQLAGWVAKVRHARQAALKLGVRAIFSPRATVMGAKLLAVGAALAEVYEDVLYKGLGEDVIAQIESSK